MRFCTHCGSQLEDDQKFCTACGAPVEADAPVENAVDDVPTTVQPVVNAVPTPTENAQAPVPPVVQQAPVADVVTPAAPPIPPVTDTAAPVVPPVTNAVPPVAPPVQPAQPNVAPVQQNAQFNAPTGLEPKKSLIESYKLFFKNYTNLSGRTRRSDYWNVFIINFIISFVCGIISAIARPVGVALSIIYVVATLLPNITLGVRRLHDIGKSGWYYLIGLIPFIGAILLIVWYATDSQPGFNQYGANPKGINPPEQAPYQPANPNAQNMQ